MAMTVVLFLLALLLLYKGGDIFVDAAIELARRFHISEIIIGATVVSIGTTIPETTVSALAAATGFPQIAYGNAVGSVICNTALIAGVLLLFAPVAVKRSEFKVGTTFFFGAALLLVALTALFGGISRLEGTLLLLCFAFYIATNVLVAARAKQSGPMESASETPLYHSLILLVVGAVMVFVGSNLLVNNGILIADALGVPERVIALTFIALGTSLPELVTAITAIVKGHAGVSLGNIIGANILNLTLVTGLAASIRSIDIPVQSMAVDLTLAAGVMALLTVPALIRGRTARWQGMALIAIYTWYCFAQISGLLVADTTNVFAPYFILH